ncbi:MAG: 3-isopropylmalate dehydratase large subunit [Bacillota bacterium]|nr:3-isopropylmalate dehydratase large subunit [Bacillota bacterium]
MSEPKTMLDKIWDLHTIEKLEGGSYLISIDRCYVHDLGGPITAKLLKKSGYRLYDTNQVIATCDHTVSTLPGRSEESTLAGKAYLPLFNEMCSEYCITKYGLGHPKQGIVHVIGPELGLSLPGMTIICCDSHTCTHGALGTLAWGVGTTELYHGLATQTMVVKKPKSMRVNIEGNYDPTGIDPMDIILYTISQLGTDFGNGYAIEFAGSVVRQLEVEDRMTLCNLSVELGSEYGFIAPDDKTYEYIKGREYAPEGEELKALIDHCRTLVTDEDVVFDKEATVDITGIVPQISWGISPSHTIGLDGHVPLSEKEMVPNDKNAYQKAISYMDFTPGQPIEGVKIDQVFIGSCSNGRISNLKRVAAVVKGKKVAPHVKAWIVSGSEKVKREAEELGLDKIFEEAGFMWGAPGCSLCSGSSGEKVAPFARCVSTTNRNFVGRQGPNARTHLAGPTTAAYAAIAGKITVAGRV